MQLPATRAAVGLGARLRGKPIHTVVMIRHGESTWNLENRFTGWSDIPLTANGEADARDAGSLLGDRGLKFDVAFTSNLERAWRTCAMVLSESRQASVHTHRSWLLNERHYGALQGHSKVSSQLLEVFGEEKMHQLRRSYCVGPPSMYDVEFLKLMGLDALDVCTRFVNPGYIDHELYESTRKKLLECQESSYLRKAGGYELPRNAPQSFFRFPTAESLLQCQERAYSYWQHVIAPRVKGGERVLIVAHANTIRALVKVIDGIDDDKIAQLKIPNGVPLVYTLDDDLQPTDLTDDIGFQANYLVSARNHSKTMSYERCVRKKLRSLFEYLDHDGDGRISQECLLRGLNHIASLKEALPPIDEISCEYEVEELIRCVPQADDKGGITLQAFLAAEETVLPKLSQLRLLQ